MHRFVQPNGGFALRNPYFHHAPRIPRVPHQSFMFRKRVLGNWLSKSGPGKKRVLQHARNGSSVRGRHSRNLCELNAVFHK